MSASAVAMRAEMGGGGGEKELEDELDALLSSGAGGQRRRPVDAGERERERELSMFRSGSAPPTIEGSLNAISGLLRSDGEVAVTAAPIPDAEALNGHGGLLSEEELRADPAYLSYYYSHGNLNPRLPPPVLSKEDWRSTQRLKAGVVGGIGDRRKAGQEDAGHGTGIAGGRSLFSQHPGSGRRMKPGVTEVVLQSGWMVEEMGSLVYRLGGSVALQICCRIILAAEHLFQSIPPGQPVAILLLTIKNQ